MPARWRAPAGVPEEVTAGVLARVARAARRRPAASPRGRPPWWSGQEREAGEAPPPRLRAPAGRRDRVGRDRVEWLACDALRPGRSSSSRCSRAVSRRRGPGARHVPRAGGGRGRPAGGGALRVVAEPSRSCSGATRAPTVDPDAAGGRGDLGHGERRPDRAAWRPRRAGSPRASSRPPSSLAGRDRRRHRPRRGGPARRLARDPALRTGRRARAREPRRARHAAHRGSHVRPGITGEDGVAVIPVVVPPGVREAHGFRPVDLHVPETALVHAVAHGAAVQADRTEQVRVVAVRAPHGAARAGTCRCSSRRAARSRSRASGAFEVVWTPPPAPRARSGWRAARRRPRRRRSASARCQSGRGGARSIAGRR